MADYDPAGGVDLLNQEKKKKALPKVNNFAADQSPQPDMSRGFGAMGDSLGRGDQRWQSPMYQENQTLQAGIIPRLMETFSARDEERRKRFALEQQTGQNQNLLQEEAAKRAHLENEQLKQFGGQNPHAPQYAALLQEMIPRGAPKVGPDGKAAGFDWAPDQLTLRNWLMQQMGGMGGVPAGGPPAPGTPAGAKPGHAPASASNVFLSQAVPDIATGGAMGMAAKAPGWWKVPARGAAMLARGPLEKLTHAISGVDETDVAAHPTASMAGDVAGIVGGLGAGFGSQLKRGVGKIQSGFSRMRGSTAAPGVSTPPPAAAPTVQPSPGQPMAAPTGTPSMGNVNVPPVASGQPSMGGVAVPRQQMPVAPAPVYPQAGGSGIAQPPSARGRSMPGAIQPQSSGTPIPPGQRGRGVPVGQVPPSYNQPGGGISNPMQGPMSQGTMGQTLGVPTVPGLPEAVAKLQAAGLDTSVMDIATILRTAANLP